MIAQGVDPQEARNRVFIDTHKYYTEDLNRRCAVEYSKCTYSPRTINKEGISEGCAVGRLLLEVEKDILDQENYQGISDSIKKYIGKDSCSIVDYLGDVYLRNLQFYHDEYIMGRLGFISEGWTETYLNLIKDEV